MTENKMTITESEAKSLRSWARGLSCAELLLAMLLPDSRLLHWADQSCGWDIEGGPDMLRLLRRAKNAAGEVAAQASSEREHLLDELDIDCSDRVEDLVRWIRSSAPR